MISGVDGSEEDHVPQVTLSELLEALKPGDWVIPSDVMNQLLAHDPQAVFSGEAPVVCIIILDGQRDKRLLLKLKRDSKERWRSHGLLKKDFPFGVRKKAWSALSPDDPAWEQLVGSTGSRAAGPALVLQVVSYADYFAAPVMDAVDASADTAGHMLAEISTDKAEPMANGSTQQPKASAQVPAEAIQYQQNSKLSLPNLTNTTSSQTSGRATSQAQAKTCGKDTSRPGTNNTSDAPQTKPVRTAVIMKAATQTTTSVMPIAVTAASLAAKAKASNTSQQQSNNVNVTPTPHAREPDRRPASLTPPASVVLPPQPNAIVSQRPVALTTGKPALGGKKAMGRTAMSKLIVRSLLEKLPELLQQQAMQPPPASDDDDEMADDWQGHYNNGLYGVDDDDEDYEGENLHRRKRRAVSPSTSPTQPPVESVDAPPQIASRPSVIQVGLPASWQGLPMTSKQQPLDESRHNALHDNRLASFWQDLQTAFLQAATQAVAQQPQADTPAAQLQRRHSDHSTETPEMWEPVMATDDAQIPYIPQRPRRATRDFTPENEDDIYVYGSYRGFKHSRTPQAPRSRHSNWAEEEGVQDSSPAGKRQRANLPKDTVCIMKQWLYDHITHPYPTELEKAGIMERTGLDHKQVDNWFINARVRIWRPIIINVFSSHMVRLIKSARERGDMQAECKIQDAASDSHAMLICLLDDQQASQALLAEAQRQATALASSSAARERAASRKAARDMLRNTS